MKSETRSFLFPMAEDPVKWAGTIVKTWVHFFLFSSALAYLTFDIVTNAAERGLGRSTYGALFIIFFQILILYGLRKLYLIISVKTKAE